MFPRPHRKFYAFCLLPAVLLAACQAPSSRQASDTEQTSLAGATPQVQLGSYGFDHAGMDRNIAPGDDFFSHANGQWLKTTEIPADRSRYSMFTLLSEKALARTRAILEEAAAQGKARAESAQFGAYYAAFMDEKTIERLGAAPLRPELDAIAALNDRGALAAYLGGTLRADVDLLNATNYYTDRLFGLWVSQHLDDPSRNAAYLVQGGLGLPDRDFYLEGGRFAEVRTAYRAHLARMFELAGFDHSEVRAGRVLALETFIARVHATQLDTNDVKKGANYWRREDFAARAPGLDWAAYFSAAQLGQQPDFIVWQPKAIIGMAQLATSQPLPNWRDYLRLRAIERAAPLLSRAFADENFAFFGTTLNGTPKQQERWKRGVAATNHALGEAVGRSYVERHFSAATKQRADTMVANVLAAFAKRIERLAWMSPETKARAQAKLAKMTVGMGFPERWRDYSALQVRDDDALGNSARAEEFEYRRNLAKLGGPVDRGEWYLLPQVVNALNIPLENRLLFPAAILEAPFFDAAADDAVNYGAIGAVIGHEISHSFDSSGALFDETGKLSNWWQAKDLERFESAAAALATQYDGYRPFPDLAVNGKLTLGENIADVAGLATAYDAYRLAQSDQPAKTLEGHTPAQRFFLGWAQAWRGKYREPALRNAVLTNVHAPEPYRAATVRNLEAWYQAFDVKPEQRLYLSPERRVEVW